LNYTGNSPDASLDKYAKSSKMYYNDRFTEEEAGSPEKSEEHYPLKALYGFDNSCREAYGFKSTGYEPMLCPREKPEPGEPKVCQPPTAMLFACAWDYDNCCCTGMPGCP